MSALPSTKPIELGTKDFSRLGRLFRAADYYLTQYRLTSNEPASQKRKAAAWAEYQDVLAELMEALHG